MFPVLIVEDNVFFSEALHAALHSRFPFLTLAKAASVQDALSRIASMRPDLIFMDVNLPDGNGLALTRRIRAAGIKATVVVLSVHDLPEYRDEAIYCGADHFFGKGSIDLDAIFGIVDSMLASRRRALIVSGEEIFQEQVCAFLSRTLPGMLVARAATWDEAFHIADTLKPHLVLLRSEADVESERRFCEIMHARCPGGEMKVVRVGDIGPEGTWICPADYCVATSAAFSQEMAAIINSLEAARPTDCSFEPRASVVFPSVSGGAQTRREEPSLPVSPGVDISVPK